MNSSPVAPGPVQRLFLLFFALNLWPHSQAATIIASPNFEDLAAALNAEQPIRLEFDGPIIFPRTLTIDRPVEIDARGRNIQFDGALARQLFIVSSGGDLTLRGITLQNAANLAAPATHANGGAIQVEGGKLRVEECVFNNNIARGGPVLAEYQETIIILPTDPPTQIVDRRLIRTAPGGNASGGAISVSNGEVTVDQSKFSGNAANGPEHRQVYSPVSGLPYYVQGGSGFGGAISATTSVLRISKSEFHQNSASSPAEIPGIDGASSGTSEGGALYAIGSDLRASESTFARNSGRHDRAYGNSTYGGAVAIERGNIQGVPLPIIPAEFSSCLFQTNVVAGNRPWGGAIFCATQVVINGCIFTGNRADGDPLGGQGGAIFLSSGTVVNSQFSFNMVTGQNYGGTAGYIVNRSYWGKGSAVLAGGVAILHSTFTGNISRKSTFPAPDGESIAGAVENSGTEGLSISASLFAPGEGPGIKGPFVDSGFNVSSDSLPFTEPTSVSAVDPQLALKPGQLELYWPAPGSPALDRVTTRLTEFDIRLARRPLTSSDSGAVEVGGEALVTVNLTGDGDLIVVPNVFGSVRLLGTSDFVVWDEVGQIETGFGTQTGNGLRIPTAGPSRFFNARLD